MYVNPNLSIHAPLMLFHLPFQPLASQLTVLLGWRKAGRKGEVRNDGCHPDLGCDSQWPTDPQSLCCAPPHSVIFWPFSLHSSPSALSTHQDGSVPHDSLLNPHPRLSIVIFNIFLEMIPLEMIIVMVHVASKTEKQGSWSQWTLEVQVFFF